jgi:hypothetical protein
MSDKFLRLEGSLYVKSFRAVLTDLSRRAALTSATLLPNLIGTQSVVIGQAGSAQSIAISLAASFSGFASAHEMNR